MLKNKIIAKEVRKSKHLNFKQKQLVIGTLLGDGSITNERNGAKGIQISHCEKQLPYLEWKKSILNPFILAEKPSKYYGSYGGYGSYKYCSIIHQDFTDIYGLLYRKINGKSKKFVTRKCLNELDNFALLVWFMDDGCITKDKEARIATNGFTLSEQKAIKIWFWQKFKIETIISRNCLNNTYFIRFNVLNSKRLMRLFIEFIKDVPNCMLYKFRFHFNLNDYTLNCFASTDVRRRNSLNTMETS